MTGLPGDAVIVNMALERNSPDKFVDLSDLVFCQRTRRGAVDRVRISGQAQSTDIGHFGHVRWPAPPGIVLDQRLGNLSFYARCRV